MSPTRSKSVKRWTSSIQPVAAAPHILCCGRNGKCAASQTVGPKELQGEGFQINAGQSQLVTFTTPGTYSITCSIHPSMQLTVVVQERFGSPFARPASHYGDKE